MMQRSPALRQQPVISLNRDDFATVCADLMHKVHRDSQPDLVIGIPTGGAWVAQAMTKASPTGLPMLELTCRRPSTKLKTGSTIKQVVARLPRPVVDRLRQIEHAMLTRKAPSRPSSGYQFVAQELERIAAWIADARRAPSLLIVDDAIDSGATLLQVTDALRNLAPQGTTIRSAVITVTTDQPLIQPDYTMFHRQLCRFPWSLDAD
jgi:hypoxanthine phosphoribosyltransferase